MHVSWKRRPVTHGVRRRSMKTVRVARFLTLPPDSKRPSRVSPCQKSAIRRPTAKVASCLKNCDDQKSLEELAREVARVLKASPLTKRRTAKTATKAGHCLCRGQHGWFLRGNTAECVHLMCRDGKSEESLLERRVERTLAARRNHETVLGSFLEFVQKRMLPVVEDGAIDGALVAYSNDCITLVHTFLLP